MCFVPVAFVNVNVHVNVNAFVLNILDDNYAIAIRPYPT